MAEARQQHSRFSDHSRETFDAVLGPERIAREKYAPFNRLVDLEEPRTETEPDGTCAWCCRRPLTTHKRPMRNPVLLSAAQDYDIGAAAHGRGCGQQLLRRRRSASGSTAHLGNANRRWCMAPICKSRCSRQRIQWPLVGHHVPARTCRRALQPVGCGHARRAGWETDLRPTRWARATASRGNKMWISSGDHELTENIVHLVLAIKIPGPDGKLIPPKASVVHRAPEAGGHTRPSDRRAQRRGAGGPGTQAGWRGTTNTLLNFGEGCPCPRALNGRRPGRCWQWRHWLPGWQTGRWSQSACST